MTDAAPGCAAILDACEKDRLSPEIALMKLLIATEDAALVKRSLHATGSAYARAVERVMAQNDEGSRRVAAMLASGVDNPPENGTVEDGIRFCRRLFDWSVAQSEEASVALYSFANPSILRDATREIDQLLTSWGVLGQGKAALDLGCGIGRLEEAFAPKLGRIVAVDVSEGMIAAARRRCAGIPNATFRVCSGYDLREHDDRSFDLVFAVDSFPYLVQSGMQLVETHFAEASRVLRRGGDFVILDFSYRHDLARDQADVARLAAAHGFDLRVPGVRPFALWDGAAYRLQTRRS